MPGQRLHVSHVKLLWTASTQILYKSTYPCVNNLEFSQNIVWIFIHSMEDNLQVAKCLCSTIRPILVALGPASLFLLRQHHNRSTVMLPNHSPEIFSCIGKWGLGSYESLLLVISLHIHVQYNQVICHVIWIPHWCRG